MIEKLTKEVLIEKYGFNTGSMKYVPKGGELLECIGQRVVRVHFTKGEDGSFTSTEDQVIIKSIWGYNPKTMTYQITFTVPDSENPSEEFTEEIIPEGFSVDIIAGGEKDQMDRFIPGHRHLEVVKDDLFYSRLKDLFTIRPTMSSEKLYEIDRDREQSRLLKYSKNIRLVGMIDGNICSFRIGKLKIRKDGRDSKRLTIYTLDDESISFVMDDKECTSMVSELGEFKVIDLQSDEEKTEETSD